MTKKAVKQSLRTQDNVIPYHGLSTLAKDVSQSNRMRINREKLRKNQGRWKLLEFRWASIITFSAVPVNSQKRAKLWKLK